MTDEMYEQKTYVWKMPESKTLTGTALLQYASLRDQFAMAALTSMLSTPQNLTDVTAKIAADWSYKIADAMMKARENGSS